MPQVTMPQLGEGVEEGTIGKWLKSVGDHVRVGDPLVEVVTDKVNAEVPSPFEGTLTSILVSEGETVGNDKPIAEVEAAGASTTKPRPNPSRRPQRHHRQQRRMSPNRRLTKPRRPNVGHQAPGARAPAAAAQRRTAAGPSRRGAVPSERCP